MVSLYLRRGRRRISGHPACTSRRGLPDLRSAALVADRDPSTAQALTPPLAAGGFAIDACAHGRDALARATAAKYDLIVLDSALDGFDGLALCRAIRQGELNRTAAIVVVSERPTESDKILTLVCGADDYLPKPVNVKEFLARVAAVFRRAQASATWARDRIERADMSLDPARRQVVVRGKRVKCSKQEFDLLYHLAASPGIVFSREELFARHWSPRHASHARLVDPIVSRLRRKIEERPESPRLILTVWGVGYKFTE